MFFSLQRRYPTGRQRAPSCLKDARFADGMPSLAFAACGSASASRRLEGILLAGYRGLVQGATFHDREDSHALVIVARGRRVLLPTAGSAVHALRSRIAAGRRGNRDHLDTGVEFEIAIGKLVFGALVFEEDNLAVAFAAGLEADADLG